jgi:hypothetical protein
MVLIYIIHMKTCIHRENYGGWERTPEKIVRNEKGATKQDISGGGLVSGRDARIVSRRVSQRYDLAKQADLRKSMFEYCKALWSKN